MLIAWAWESGWFLLVYVIFMVNHENTHRVPILVTTNERELLQDDPENRDELKRGSKAADLSAHSCVETGVIPMIASVKEVPASVTRSLFLRGVSGRLVTLSAGLRRKLCPPRSTKFRQCWLKPGPD